jgi:hypothetical protein
MDHDTVVLAIECMALAIAVALGIWRFKSAHRSSAHAGGAIRPAARAYDMRRDGQRLSME